MKISGYVLGAWGILAGIAPASGQSNDLAKMARAFGSRPSVEQISLSPDGTKITFISPLEGQASTVIVADLTKSSGLQPILRSSGNPERLASCNWVANDRLLCSAYAAVKIFSGDITYSSRLFALNADGSDVKAIETDRGTGEQLGMDLYGGNVVDWLPDQDDKILMMRNYVPEKSSGTMLAQRASGLGVDLVDTRTLRKSNVVRPKNDAVEYISDGRGVIRIEGLKETNGTGYVSGEIHYLYRREGSKRWEQLSEVDMYRNGFDPYGVDPDKNVAYGLKKLNGRLAAYSVSLDGNKTETLIYAHPQVDVDGFVEIGRQRRIVGVTYATEKRHAVFFDPVLKELSASLSNALPSHPAVNFVDSSLDEQKLLLWAGSDVDPGHYYLFDKQTHQLKELLLQRYGLEKVRLAPLKPITYSARDGAEVPGYLTLPVNVSAKGLPAIVMPHGGPGARDEWGFDWLCNSSRARAMRCFSRTLEGRRAMATTGSKRTGSKVGALL